ncbi:methylamine utilization protein [Neptunicella sp. SCSIO 80796]|uniref:methylamine utilization protein n=1 Tax=Neptunicella plasticusilytica TaxID=3117012 RepID=UPI003A4E0032
MSLIVSCHQTFAAQKIIVHVQDQQGNALQHAVVEIIAAQGTAQPLSHVDEVAIMDQVNKQFAPKVLLIEKGQSVLFPNSDDIRHHVYSFSPAKPFELKLYAGRPKAPIEFNHHGVAVLGCNIHDSMVGYIYIANSDDAQITDEQGNAQLSLSAGVDISVSVWHSQNAQGAEKRQVIPLAELPQVDGRYQISMKVEEPAARDTFGAQFKH